MKPAPMDVPVLVNADFRNGYLGMLRRAENVRFTHQPGFWTGKGPAALTIGKRTYLLRKMSKADFQRRLDVQLRRPRLVATVNGKRYWHYKNRFYWETDVLRSEEVHALITTNEQRKSLQIERAQATVAMGSQPRVSTARKRIPDDVKQYIWTRDAGQCQSCGSVAELQFDHIIPVSKGGSNNVENLQILCGPCNRSKAAGLTTRR